MSTLSDNLRDNLTLFEAIQEDMTHAFADEVEIATQMRDSIGTLAQFAAMESTIREWYHDHAFETCRYKVPDCDKRAIADEKLEYLMRALYGAYGIPIQSGPRWALAYQCLQAKRDAARAEWNQRYAERAEWNRLRYQRNATWTDVDRYRRELTAARIEVARRMSNLDAVNRYIANETTPIGPATPCPPVLAIPLCNELISFEAKHQLYKVFSDERAARRRLRNAIGSLASFATIEMEIRCWYHLYVFEQYKMKCGCDPYQITQDKVEYLMGALYAAYAIPIQSGVEWALWMQQLQAECAAMYAELGRLDSVDAIQLRAERDAAYAELERLRVVRDATYAESDRLQSRIKSAERRIVQLH